LSFSVVPETIKWFISSATCTRFSPDKMAINMQYSEHCRV
jgi:hypothetical protein